MISVGAMPALEQHFCVQVLRHFDIFQSKRGLPVLKMLMNTLGYAVFDLA